MNPNPYVEQRERLASVVTTLPRELLQTNAAPLMAIVSELQASTVIEIGVIQSVAAVDAGDRQAVATQRRILEDYQGRRLYDRDRTHCSNIDRIATQIRTPYEGTSPELDQLDEVLTPLRSADVELVDDIEQVLGEAVAAIGRIGDSNRLEDAISAQSQFAERMQPKIKQMKDSLSRMNALVGKLIDLM